MEINDGCFGSRDAALNEPYTDVEGGDGILYYTDEKERGSLETRQVRRHIRGEAILLIFVTFPSITSNIV